jgi:hypothetical protein
VYTPACPPPPPPPPITVQKWLSFHLSPYTLIDRMLTPKGPGVQISARRQAVLTYVFCGFPQSFKANDGTVPSIRPRPFPFISFPIHYSLIVSFDAISRELLTASLKEAQTECTESPKQNVRCVMNSCLSVCLPVVTKETSDKVCGMPTDQGRAVRLKEDDSQFIIKANREERKRESGYSQKERTWRQDEARK